MKLTTALAITTLIATPVLAGNVQNVPEPTETKGVSVSPLQQNDLSAQLPQFKGHDLRARRITFEAGASFTKHNHANRPGFVYVESGKIIENRNGKSKKFKAGDTWIEKADTEHWLRNISNKDAVIIVVDLPARK
jgi:quercetin dioxygenase-like cupin family protein